MDTAYVFICYNINHMKKAKELKRQTDLEHNKKLNTTVTHYNK